MSLLLFHFHQNTHFLFSSFYPVVVIVADAEAIDVAIGAMTTTVVRLGAVGLTVGVVEVRFDGASGVAVGGGGGWCGVSGERERFSV